jgi:amidophosphoribosyltransferase
MCGIFGISTPNKNVSKLIYLGLYALQHRGQESAGISVLGSDQKVKTYKNMGLVSQVFGEEKLELLSGDMGIGHVRYSTTGSSHVKNAQPVVFDFNGETASLVHNGNLVNCNAIKNELMEYGENFSMSSDTEMIAALFKHFNKTEKNIEECLKLTLKKIQGAYSLLLMLPGKLIAVRDPNAFRPLVIGEIDNHYVFASESAALDIVGANFIREVLKGEVVILENGTLRTFVFDNDKPLASCVFENIYFARPDSNLSGRNVYEFRVKLGEMLFQDSPAEADIVIAVPDSGIPSAIGYAKASGIPYAEGLIKNRYVGRTFINPDPIIRELGVRIKLNPISHVIKGKRIVVIDDSIVRGTTSRKLLKLLREAGAKEIHFRISSPPFHSPCFYGIDTPIKEDLIANTMSLEEIRKHLGADSLGYLTIPSLIKASGANKKEFCLACFNGEYPVQVPEEMSKLKLEFNLKPSN